ncbi:MAG: adenylate/guanylate cyclase domain-containing protein [Rhodospirillales bacterium]|nr:adenylate/guanylate cyclase domain-containing protein [Rhodospirillales bacterium]
MSNGDARASAKGRWLSLSRTVTIGLIVLLLASAGSSFWVAISTAHRNTIDLLDSLAAMMVSKVATEVDSYLETAQTQVDYLSSLVSKGAVDPNDEKLLTDLMIGALAAAPQVSGIVFVKADRQAILAGRRDGEFLIYRSDWRDKDEADELFENWDSLGKPSWRQLSYLEDFGETHVIVGGVALYKGEAMGFFLSVVPVRSISEYLAANDVDSATKSFVLVERETVLAASSLADVHPDPSAQQLLPSLAEIDDPLIASIWDERAEDMNYMLKDQEIEGHVVPGEDGDYIYFYRDLANIGLPTWTVGVAVQGSKIDSSPFDRLMLAGVISAVILAIAIVAGLLVARSTVRPLRSLAAASSAIGNLDLAHVETLKGSPFRELDVTAKAFNTMVQGLRWFETYVPRNLVLHLMRTYGADVQSEERPVTVLFTDIVGFTQIGSSLLPADLARLLNDHFTLLAKAIEAEDGTIDKYIGDSIMAFWGAPIDQPDHATRACRAALAIARAVTEDNRQRLARSEQPIRLRIGLHSGSVVVGNIGAPGRINYTLIGDTVNSAQRLETLGKQLEPDADIVVLMSGETRAELSAPLDLLPRGKHLLRGRERHSEVFQLVLPLAENL